MTVFSHLTQMPGKSLRGIRNTIAIASGKGGVGKSTVTINLAVALAKNGARVGILDADIYGPSLPMLMGKTSPVQMQEDYYLPIFQHGIYAMSIAYLTNPGNALIWRGPMLAKALIQMLDCTYWDELDYLLIDLPPGTGDIQLSLAQKIPLTGAVIVTTPQNLATLDAEKAVDMFDKTNVRILGIIENMALHVCQQCGHEEAVFGQGGGFKMSRDRQIPMLGQLPLLKAIQAASDEGMPIALGETAVAEKFREIAFLLEKEISALPLNIAS